MTRARSFHVITVVWGRPYIELFLDVAVPNQMTPGNLDALPAGSRYRVFTSPEDVATLAASAMLDRVRELMQVDLEVMPDLSDSAVDPIHRMTAAHRRALADARDACAGLVFLNADHFMSEGALAAVVRRHAAGSRAVACTGIRLNRAEFVAALQARGGVRVLPPRELVALALSDLHAFTLAHMSDAAQAACSPISVYWNVPGEGILARSLFLHPLMVDPVCRDALPKTTIDAKYVAGACPVYEQVHVVTDSDELSLFELSSASDGVIETAPGGISLWRAAIMFTGADSHQKRYWANPIRLHAGEIGTAWKIAEMESARFARQVIRLRIAVRSIGLTVTGVRRLRRRAEKLRKRSRAAMRPFSPARVRRFGVLAVRRMVRRRERAARAGRGVLRRARRSAVLLTHAGARHTQQWRKRVARATRRAAKRVRAAASRVTRSVVRSQ